MKMQRLKQYHEIIVCPNCYSSLMWNDQDVHCLRCSIRYPYSNNAINFHNGPIGETSQALFQKDLMCNRTITAILFNLGKTTVSSEYNSRKQLSKFLAEMRENDILVDLGSGNRRLREKAINIDLFCMPNVDLVADIVQTPLRDNSADYVVIDSVLEHVPEPQRVVKEIHRILKTNGQVLSVTPFVFPYHGYPAHYYNFSKEGLQFLFRDFKHCQIEIYYGPSSALTHLVSEYCTLALSGNNRFWYTIFKGFFLMPICVFKYLDRLWTASGVGTNIASHLCLIARK